MAVRKVCTTINVEREPKENAYSNWLEMIKESWTWKRLTEDEQKKFLQELENFCGEFSSSQILKGTYDQRWSVLNALYSFYLDGLGYQPSNWREEEAAK